jgi:uncharacterized membrane protein
MKSDGKFMARVALFSALAYVLALASIYIPNVSLSFIVVFTAGALFGAGGGLAVGGIGMFLWTILNPYGMATLPITIAQITGMMLVGLLGASVNRSATLESVRARGFWMMALLGLIAGLIFQIIVSGVSAWVFRPFWESLYAGLTFSLLTIISNAIIFPACYPLLVKLSAKERRH